MNSHTHERRHPATVALHRVTVVTSLLLAAAHWPEQARGGEAVAGGTDRIITADGRQPGDVSLNGEWDFVYAPPSAREVPALPPDSAYEAKILVPGRWDDQLVRFEKTSWWPDARFVFNNAKWNARYLSGVGWHRTKFDAPAKWRDCPVTLTIGWAAESTCYVWLNQSFVGQYEYGFYTPCTFDLTPHLKLGETNELVIALDNTRGLAIFQKHWGLQGHAAGLSRPVTLHVSEGPGRITDLYVRPGKDLMEVVWQALLEVPAQKSAPASRLLWEVCDTAGEVVDRGEFAVPPFTGARQALWKQTIPALRPWSDRHPYLYWTEIRWLAGQQSWDNRQQRFGLRRWSRDGRKLFLNGQPIYLRGETSMQMLNPSNELPMSKEFWLTNLKRAKDLGFNFHVHSHFVSWMPLPPELLEAADELGMIVQFGDQLTSTVPSYRNRHREVWEPMVLWTRGYPSACVYGFGSEDEYYEGAVEQFQKQYDVVKSLHPESMVMPQQAARGIGPDYGLPITEKLKQYTRATDVFGSYLDGTFGYDFFSPNLPWRRADKIWTNYQRPVVVHELYMRSSYPNPDNARKYTKQIQPYMYTDLSDQLTLAGLVHKWQTYWENSGRLNSITRKYCVEKTRKCRNLAGYEFLGFDDGMHYLAGVLDEFHQFKPGDNAAGILRYTGENVLLLDFEDGDGGLNRSYWAKDRLPADIMLSLYGPRAIAEARLTWVLKESGNSTELGKGERTVKGIPNGQVGTIHSLTIDWPDLPRTTKLNFAVSLTGSGYQIANDWDFWVFPQMAPPEVAAVADAACKQKLEKRYPEIALRTADSTARLQIVSEITSQEVEYLARGGDILLLGTRPFPLQKNAGNPSLGIYPAMSTRLGQAVGAVINTKHPVLKDLPDEGWGDWIYMPLLARAPRVVFDTSYHPALDIRPFDPIVEMISEPGRVDKISPVFEARVGKGRLLVSSCPAEMSNPSKVALMDGLLRYACGDAFHPPMELEPEVLTALLDAQHRPRPQAAFAQARPRERSPEAAEWHKKPVTIEFNTDLFYQVNGGEWKQSLRLEIEREGITTLLTKPEADTAPTLLGRARTIGIDLTPPNIALLPRPELGQRGSVYYAVAETVFSIHAQDELSGVRSIEVKIDEGDYRPYVAPFQLKLGTHTIVCRVTDQAGNQEETMTGPQMAPTTKATIVVTTQQ